MTDTPEEKYATQKEAIWGRQNTYSQDGYVPMGQMPERDALLIENICAAFDPNESTTRQQQSNKEKFPTDKQRDRAITTLWGWMYELTRLSRDLHELESYPDGLYVATSSDINNLTQSYVNGTVPSTAGMKESSAQSYQLTARVFYRFYQEDLEVDPEAINVYSSQEPSVNPDDILTRDEILSLTQAADHPRDLMVFHLLLYTGIRSNAARTLRIGDIDLENRTYRFNNNIGGEGLKGADELKGPRPLLFAHASVENWINNHHPVPGDPSAYLITAKQEWKQRPHEVVGHNMLRYVLDQLKKQSGVSKPLHPHMLRHNFVTICKTDYHLDNDTIKYLIAHKPESMVMERTYSHLTGDDHINEVERKVGPTPLKENQSKFTPQSCSCGAETRPDAKACYSCGVMFTPDAKHVIDNITEP